MIQLVLPEDKVDAACDLLQDLDPANWWHHPVKGDAKRTRISVLAKPAEVQEIFDGLQNCLDGSDGWRMVLLPVEGVAPELLTEQEQVQENKGDEKVVREEIVNSVQAQGALTTEYLLMVGLSTVVAAIGLSQDNVAVVIGAMVIAPMLGPIMAFSLAVALGANKMLLRAIFANLAGIAACVAASAVLALFVEVPKQAQLLDYSQPISLATVILPLASGAAAALATASRKSTALVGVMVAAAILPPIVATGLLMADGAFSQAFRAGIVFLINMICITLSAQVVFVARGVHPRRWSEQKAVETSRMAHMATLAALVAAIVLLIYLFDIP